MLSKEDNHLLTRTGPGTPMGELFRLYWIPALKSEELTSDGKPQRVRLLGEDLIAFRDTEGKGRPDSTRLVHTAEPLFIMELMPVAASVVCTTAGNLIQKEIVRKSHLKREIQSLDRKSKSKTILLEKKRELFGLIWVQKRKCQNSQISTGWDCRMRTRWLNVYGKNATMLK